MAIKGYMESSLLTSEVFQGLNDPKTTDATKRAINLIKNAKHLTNEDIEAAYISLKQVNDGLTRAAIKAFDEERIVLVYNNVSALSVTQALPFITFKTSKGYITYVFMDKKYITINRDGIMNLQAPVLRDLLIGALIANGIKRDYNNLSTNQYLQKIFMSIYTKFITRIINREFSIAANKEIFDIIQYWINKFFLLNIFGAADSPENIETIASSHLKFIDELKYEEIKNQYNEANPSKFSDLLELLKTTSSRMKTLHISTFLSDWINYYYVPSMLAVDNIEYLIFMIVTLLNGNNIISISASDIVKETKNIKSLRSELLKLI